MTHASHKRLLALLFALALPWLAAGCNTMEGLGEDMGAAGDAIDEEAEEEQAD
jgi:predicted small secreted protein